MRTNYQIDTIKKSFSDPYLVDNFINENEITHLINLFENDNGEGADPNQKKVYKNTGPVTLDIHKYLSDPVVDAVMNRIKMQIGDFSMTTGFFFFTNYPHIIHNDDLFELPNNVYKAITIPLRLDSDEEITEYSNLCFFDQHYFHGPSKFFKNSKDIPTYYNKCIYEYDKIDGLAAADAIDDEVYQKHFTHLKKEWLEGLSLHSMFEWKPGSCMIFDSLRLHCASDFRKYGIKSKLGLSIFTKKNDKK
jgi:hypothetical protein